MTLPPIGRRLAIVGLIAATSAWAAPPRILVAGAWTRPAAAGMNAAGYMTITNRGPVPDRLNGASSPLAARVTLHQSRMVGSISEMRPVDGLRLVSHGRVALRPGGLHLMLEGLKRPLRGGDRVPVILQFQRAGPVRARLIVRGGAAAMPGMKM